MKFSIVFLSFLFIGVYYSQSSSQVSTNGTINAITTAMPFLSINPDSRSGGMGDAGTSLNATPSSIYWNTSNIVFSDKKAEFGISYVPWLRQLTNDIHLSYVSGYRKLGKRQAVTGALRYFSLGNITFTDDQGNVIRDDKPSEFELALGYAFKLSDRFSIGINGKYSYSNLAGGMIVSGAQTKAGVAGMTDVSFTYRNPDIILSGKKGIYTFATTINNVGNKISYSNTSTSDFLPMNLKLGSSYTSKIDEYNDFTFAVDLQKLLVPTPPIYNGLDMIAGKSNDVGVISGIVQSFSDAPGQVVTDDNGEIVLDANGKAEIVKGSKFKEELREINIGTGLEYNYNKVFAVRTGFFYESVSKGGRQYFNFGVGLKYNIIGFDISYIAALKRNNPLANTLRFSIRFDLGAKDSND
jgi:hypothetical protein